MRLVNLNITYRRKSEYAGIVPVSKDLPIQRFIDT